MLGHTKWALLMICKLLWMHASPPYGLVNRIILISSFTLCYAKIFRSSTAYDHLTKHCKKLCFPFSIKKGTSGWWDLDGLMHVFMHMFLLLVGLVDDLTASSKLVIVFKDIIFICWMSSSGLMRLTSLFWTINVIVFFNFIRVKPLTVITVDSEGGLTKKAQVLSN